MKNIIDEVRRGGDSEKTIQMGDDSFILILSHGSQLSKWRTDVVSGVDGFKDKNGGVVGVLDIKAIADEMLSPSACPQLDGKPKIFFIQACRGSKQLAPNSIDFRATRKLLQEPPPQEGFYMYFAYATPLGYRASHHRRSGSIYIRELCEYLARVDKQDIVTILEELSQDSAFREIEFHGGTVVSQVPTYTSNWNELIPFFRNMHKYV